MGKDKNSKKAMANDADENIYFGKEQPFGVIKQEGPGLLNTHPETVEEYAAVDEEYTEDDALAEHVSVRHRNRISSKGDDTFKGKENRPQSNKGSRHTINEETTTTEIEQLPGELTRERFSELANFKDGISVTLYFSTNNTGVEANGQFDVIAFKSTLNTVEQNLAARGHDPLEIKALMQPAYELASDDLFWKDLTHGLGIFIAKDFFKYIKMPVEPEPMIVLESTFYVTPLIPLLTNKDYFYLLVISKQKVKLFRADAFGMQHIAVELPQGIEEVKRSSDLDAATLRRGESGKKANPASMSAQSNGAGGGNPDGKENLATYFEAVDDILWEKVFNKENAPLVLAGVEYELPIYKSICDYHNVWEKGLTGNREHQDTKSLHADAKGLMEPYFMQRTTKALEQFGNLSATGLTSSIIGDVIPASYYGKIAQLFVCTGEHVWGTFDEMTNTLVEHETQQHDSEDLVDNAVVKTLATGGEVFLLHKEQMPTDSCVSAIMRY